MTVQAIEPTIAVKTEVPPFIPLEELNGRTRLALALKEASFGAEKDKYGTVIVNPYTFSHNRMLLLSLKNYGSFCHLVGIMPSCERVDLYVSKNLPVTIVDDEAETKELLNLEEKWKFKKGLANLLRIGMTIGADPEIFVTHETGELIPAPAFLGSKTKPSKTAGKGESENGNCYGGYPCYWDGFQAEFTTWSGTCLGWLIDSIHWGLKGILTHARDKFPDAKLCLNPVFNISRELLDASPAEVVEFGCTPSLNAYGLSVDLPAGRDVLFRSAGGHLHFGIGNLKPEVAVRMVKSLDAILGVASVALFDGIDNPMRRQFYGLAGEYRLPPHGLEYRTLSAAWLSHPFIANLIFDVGRKALAVGHGDYLSKIWSATEEETVACITDSNVEKAREILLRNKNTLCNVIMAAYGGLVTHSDTEILFNVFYNGMGSVLQDPRDIEINWGLTNGKYIFHGETNVYKSLGKLRSGIKI